MLVKLKYFEKSEFACPCCGQSKMDNDFLRKIDLVRELYGSPLVPSSACRCEKHNAKVGGAKQSRHLITDKKDCDAVDIPIGPGSDRWSLVRCCLSLGLSVGVYSWGVHVDNRPDPILFQKG